MLLTWLGTLLGSAAWMRIGGGMLVLSALLLPVGLLAAVAGLVRGGRRRWLYVLDGALMIAAVMTAVLVHVALTGGV